MAGYKADGGIMIITIITSAIVFTMIYEKFTR